MNSVSRLQMQLHLHGLQQNATDLRKQLSQLHSVKILLKRAEAELNVRVADALRKQEDPLQRQRLLVEEERLKYLNEEELIIQQLHDLEKSVEEIQKESSVNHKLVTVQELEEKASVLRKLGETLTELKNQFPGLQSKMRVVLRVEVEAVKFLKEEPHRLDALLKRCKTITETLATMRKQANEGVWKKQEDFSHPSSKHNDDLRKFADFDIPTSPPLTISDLGGGNSLSNWSPHASLSRGHGNLSGPHKDSYPPVPHKGKALEELERRAAADKALSVEVRLAAERDWEEKRASLTQYSAQDINRLLEETQAELMKAIPDLDFAAKQIKPSSVTASSQNPQSGAATLEHRVSKPQHKLSGKEGGSRRGSGEMDYELTVPRYRTEKPSKSPPPPPPRRSFPSSPGLITRSGEPLIPGKCIKKSESEETEGQKPHIKLRRAVSENPRPASTPPTLASGDRDEGEEERIAAELEGGNGSCVGKVLHTSATSKLKHLQQNSTDKTKGGRREDSLRIQGQQQALGTNRTSGGIEPYLSGIKTGIFSGRVPSPPAAAFAPGLRKYPQGGAIPSFTASPSQAKALLASLTASGLSAEALLLSSALRHHRLLREQRASSMSLPSSQSSSPTPTPSSSSSSSSPTTPTPTPSLSPSSPTPLGSSLTLSSGDLKPGGRSLDSCSLDKEEGVKRDLTPGNAL
ncbi:hypothetical protein F2P81_015227 [Scophthalmus maximus]|uniref:SRC kinase signaling inhibitor 1 n=1 Tax=Scophthalmus maximus TaxID=52904 RepID=A0A6A4SI70_SCOMX|nr:hypothetical protein F2P81_015227 [Scophthalmus maximus]